MGWEAFAFVSRIISAGVDARVWCRISAKKQPAMCYGATASCRITYSKTNPRSQISGPDWALTSSKQTGLRVKALMNQDCQARLEGFCY